MIENLSCDSYGEFLITTIVRKLAMCLLWQVFDYVSWSKTCHVLDMASYWLRALIENLSCVRYGKLSVTWVDRKLVIYLMWQVIEYENVSKTHHVLDMASFWLRELIENSSAMCLIWRVIDCVSWSKTSHVFDMASFWLRELIKNSSAMCLIWRVIDCVSWS